MQLEEKINLLLGDFSHLSPRIRHLEYNTEVCGERIDVRCSYISFRDGQPTFDDFIDILADHVTPFCLPRTEINKAKEKIACADHVGAGRIMSELSERAKSLFIKAKKGSHRSGEAGEIVLYILTEWILKAPQIVSKMYLKTNNNMPVHGTDGIHARYDHSSKKLLIYWGESKAHVTLSSSLGDALNSIKDFIDEGLEKREIGIVSTFLDLEGMEDDAKEAILSYLDPYNEKSNERISSFSCAIIFEHAPQSDINIPHDHAEQEFIETINQYASDFISNIKQRVENRGLESQRFEFFLLPVPSVQHFRDKFQQKIGWPDD